MTEVEQIKHLLGLCTEEQRREIFNLLRAEFPIHAIESKLNAQAEIILEAIDRASDLTLRGIRGVIAEAAFEINVVRNLVGWRDIPLDRDYSYDFLLEDEKGQVKVQVKMQRLTAHRPMMANEGYAYLPSDMYVVETQRTRGGVNPGTNEDTRPYRFGEFDILAVSMHPSTKNWAAFMYTVARWLVARPENDNQLLKYQPVAITPNGEWTANFQTCVEWLRSGEEKKVWARPIVK